MCVLDDCCAQMHGQSDGADQQFLNKLNQQVCQHEHYRSGADCFVVKHYAGDVLYNVDGFCERNRDVLYPDLIQLMQQSSNAFLRSLFPEQIASGGAKSKPTSASTKIKTQANDLVGSLMKCSPHYVRCIKPNETKKPLDWDDTRVRHQVEYLGLKENIRVRRAGFAYRRPFDKFLWRYAILTEQTWPRWNGDPRQGIEIICRSVNMDREQYQLGKSKIFIKNPESLFLLEEIRERKYDHFARIIQKAWRQYNARKHHAKLKEQASDILYGKKERRRFSLNRNFVGDYIGLEYSPALQVLVGKRERVEFAHQANKYDRRFKVSKVDLLVTARGIWLIGREKVKKGPEKGRLVEIVKRQIDMNKIASIGLSPFQDDFLVLQVKEDYSSLLETPFKTEFLTTLSKRYKERMNGATLPLDFKSQHMLTLKKGTFGGGTRTINFALDPAGTALTVLQPSSKGLLVSVGPGLPNTTRPSMQRPAGGYVRHSNAQRTGGGIQAVRAAPSRPPAPSAHVAPPQQQYQPHQAAQPARNGSQYGGVATAFTGMNVSGRARNGAPQTQEAGAQPTRGAPPPRAPKPAPPARPKPAVPMVRALYPYDAQDTDELSFSAGDEWELMQKHESGWWQGKFRGRTGLFPANYVEELGVR